MIGRRLARVFRDEAGLSSVEYALLAGALVVCLAAAGWGIRAAQTSAYQAQQKGLQQWKAP